MIMSKQHGENTSTKFASPFNELVRKWHEKWMREGKYNADPCINKKKFFVNFPYPYINGYLHLGHGYTSLKVDLISRLKRKEGFNVLFPQGFHATGQPIIAAAQRIAEGEKKQIEILKRMGIKDIEKFKDPMEWIRFFSEKAYEHLNLLGYGIDWRRRFITTEINKAYDKFIKWQYKKLYDKGYIYKGSHPVVYCPKDKCAIGDHDRVEGEGVVPERVVMIKFKLLDSDKYLLAMTYRPETLWGVTNIWVNPAGEYVVYETNQGERLIISKEVIENFKFQDIDGNIIEQIKGEDLLGKEVENLVTGDVVKVLPASFVDTKVGSGIVMSVPSHAPYDYAALKDLENDKRWAETVKNMKMISLINLKGYGEFPAKEICERMGISSQKDKDKLEKATKNIYKLEYHQGILKDIFGRFAGMYVKDAKEKIISFLKEKGIAFEFYILPERVVCRCLTHAVVKIVHDQWFIKYSDRKWKDLVHKAIDKMRFYPPNLKDAFHEAVEWLCDWAFTREKGLGSRLPFDKEKLIESLSDSTIYMAYYPLAKYLEHPDEYDIDIDSLQDSFFDYVFLGIGDIEHVAKENKISKDLLKKIRDEFIYWYDGGFELRISGKDLVKNHLIMMLFHHVAIFPEEFYPKGVGVNGYVMVDGKKMSKSLGNFYTLKDAYELFGAEETRFVLAYAGNVGFDDPNFETSLVKEIREKLIWFENFALRYYNNGREDVREIDKWFVSKIKILSDLFIESMNALMTRDAIKYGFFDMLNALRWYMRRCLNNPNKEVMRVYVEQQLHILSVVIPHYAQEIWSKLNKDGDIIDLPFIEFDDVVINKEAEEFEDYLAKLIDDAKELLELIKRKRDFEPKELEIVIADNWKYMGYEMIKGMNNVKEVINYAKNEDFFGVPPSIFAEFVSKNFVKIKKMPYKNLLRDNEIAWLKESKEFLENELGINIKITEEACCKEEKAKFSMPYKPAMIVR